MEEEDPSIIPNVLLSKIPLLDTVLRDKNLTEQFIKKTDLNISQLAQALKKTNNESKMQIKKFENDIFLKVLRQNDAKNMKPFNLKEKIWIKTRQLAKQTKIE